MRPVIFELVSTAQKGARPGVVEKLRAKTGTQEAPAGPQEQSRPERSSLVFGSNVRNGAGESFECKMLFYRER